MKFVDFMADSRDFYTGLIDPVCKKYGLTQMEFNILLFLANNPEFDTAAQITKKRAFTKSHVSMSVRSLEERGLLTGEYYGADRRTIHLKLTDAAAPMVSDGKNVQKRAARDHLPRILPRRAPDAVRTYEPDQFKHLRLQERRKTA